MKESSFSLRALFSVDRSDLPGLGLINFFLPSSPQGWGVEEYRQARIVIMTSLLAAFCTLILTIARGLAVGHTATLDILSSSGFGLFLLLPVLLKLSGRLGWAAALLVVVSITQFWWIAFFSSGIFSSILYPLFLVATISFLIGTARLGWFAVSMSCMAVISLALLSHKRIVVDHAHGPGQVVKIALTYCLTFLFCAVVVHYFELDRRRARKIAVEALEALAIARREAVHANEQKSSFLANMSHELRTPLNAIIGYSEMLGEDFEETGAQEQADDVQRIQRSAHHLLGLINDLLDLSKIEAGKLELSIETFDVVTIAEEVIDAIRPLAQKKQNTLQFARANLEGSALRMQTADPLRVRQVLFNLLSNACKFTEEGEVSLHIKRLADGFVFEVSDTGIGMTQAQQERLFQPFVQAEAEIAGKFGGTGLGLFVSRELCTLMQGSITLQSEEGVGSTFFVQLPADITTPLAS